MTLQSRKGRIAAAFGRAAPHYDDHASLQAQVAAELAAMIGRLALPAAPLVLEIGCGTGLLTRHLAALAGVQGAATDLSPAMVATCRSRIGGPFHYVAMDGERPAIAHAFDLIAASLVLQWFEAPAPALAGLHPLLRPDGVLAFATLGPATLAGWRAAHQAEGLPPPVAAYVDPATLLTAWPGPAQLSRQLVDIAHGSGRAFLADLRGIGAQTPRPGHRSLRPGELGRVMRRFEREHGAIARYDVVYGCLRA